MEAATTYLQSYWSKHRTERIVLRTNTGPLYDQFLFSKLHTIQACDGLIGDEIIDILSKSITLGQAGRAVLDQVEGPEGAKWRQELLHLVLPQVVGQTTDEDLVLWILHNSGNNAGQVHGWLVCRSRKRLVIARPSNLERLVHEVYSIKSECLWRFIDGPELQEGEVFVQVDLHGQDGVSWGLGEACDVHLVVEELHHRIFSDAKRNVANVKSSSLSGHLASSNWHLDHQQHADRLHFKLTSMMFMCRRHTEVSPNDIDVILNYKTIQHTSSIWHSTQFYYKTHLKNFPVDPKQDGRQRYFHKIIGVCMKA